MNRKRLRDWGIAIGELPTGPRNKLSDVPGVTVGHATVADSGHNTGLTVILPASGNLYADKLIAASHIINGYGKTAGSIQPTSGCSSAKNCKASGARRSVLPSRGKAARSARSPR